MRCEFIVKEECHACRGKQRNEESFQIGNKRGSMKNIVKWIQELKE